jgi:hypothetical protein
MTKSSKKSWPKWLRDDGSVVACTEKVKVMAENFDELKQLAQDALEDGLLMEVSEQQMRDALHHMVDELINPYSSNPNSAEPNQSGPNQSEPNPAKQ